jgi:hypothetical protein
MIEVRCCDELMIYGDIHLNKLSYSGSDSTLTANTFLNTRSRTLTRWRPTELPLTVISSVQ